MNSDGGHEIARGVVSDDGIIHIELSKEPVSYHIVRCLADGITSEQSRSLAISSCWLVCMCTDVIRGRQTTARLQRRVTGECLQRLETLAQLMQDHVRSHSGPEDRLRFLPVVPHKLIGMFVSATTLELSAYLTIGRTQRWANLVLRRIGGRWMCTVADIG